MKWVAFFLVFIHILPFISASKSIILGLTAMDNPIVHPPPNLPSPAEINVHPNVYSGAVIYLLWAEIEPEQGNYNFTAIENAKADIQAYNTKYPNKPVVGKLRVKASGAATPEWVFNVAGGPYTLADSKIGYYNVSSFWSSTYRNLWQKLQSALANAYDNDPLIGVVAISECSSDTDEPFVIPLNKYSYPVLKAAGYNDSQMMECLMGAIDDHSVWQNTVIDYTFNLFRNSDNFPTLVSNPDFTISVMKAFRAKYGSRGILANHGLQPTLSSDAIPVYNEMLVLGKPVTFQTVAPLVDWNASVAVGLSYGMTELEVWDTHASGSSYGPDLSEAVLSLFVEEIMKANSPSTTTTGTSAGPSTSSSSTNGAGRVCGSWWWMVDYITSWDYQA